MTSTPTDRPEQRIFLRKASGLIRTASLTDVLIYDVGLVSIGLGVGTLMYYGPAFYPGGNIILACIIAGILMAAICWGMITWSATLPRSGGIYVFGSRSLPPFLALTLSLVEITAWLFYCAIAAYWIVLLGVSPMLALLGYLNNNESLINAANWVVQPWPKFIIGSLILLVSSFLLTSGMRSYLLSQKIVFTAAMIGSVLLIVVLAVYSQEDFVASFNAMMGPLIGEADPYNAIIASAKENGWTTEGANFGTTILLSNWAFLPLIGSAFSIAIGGEIKSVQRSQTVGMLGALVVTLVIWIITVSLANSVFGYDFIGSAVFNILNGTGVAMPTDATITLLTGILTQSWFVTLLVSIGFITWIWMWIPGMHTFAIRAVVAWAFDRIAPAPLGDISQTRHTPTTAIWITWIVMVIFMALFSFTDFFATIVILIEAAVLAWSIVLAAGIFFPYVRPDIYSKSPIAGRRIFGLPVMTVACLLGTIASQFYFWVLFSDPVAAGHQMNQVIIVGGVFVIGIVFYFVMKAIRQSQGVNVELAFKEIPIE
ncbi:MAG TPA: amino acid permease [Alphaproteobacteria bacterium]|nr:amino acid permease [Alphaproteobacteria bacterium]